MSVRKAAGLESNDYAPRLGEKVDKADIQRHALFRHLMDGPMVANFPSLVALTPPSAGQMLKDSEVVSLETLIGRMQSSVKPSEFYGVGLQDAFNKAAENAATFGNAPVWIGADSTIWTTIVAQPVRPVPQPDQRGWFAIDRFQIEAYPRNAMAVLEGVIVVGAEIDPLSDVIRYCGMHAAFDEVKAGDTAPNYDWMICNGTRIWRRLGK